MEEYFAEGVMEMPTPCSNCGGIFDLNDGGTSEKWYPNTIICASCSDKESQIIEREEEIEGLEAENEDYFSNLKWNRNRLKELREQLSQIDRNDNS